MADNSNNRFSRFAKKESKPINTAKKHNNKKSATIKQRNHKFYWKGIDKEGKKTSGALLSTSVIVAKNQLQKQGLKIISVKQESKIMAILTRRPIKKDDITRLTRQLATMISSGIPIIQCFDIATRGSENMSLNDLILNIKTDVQSGMKLSHALAKYPKFFSQLYCALVEAGEESGSLGKMLDRLATYMEKIEAIIRKIKKAMFYPAAVIVVGIVVSGILLLKVIPEFKSLFEGFGAKLPAFTMFVLNISEWTQNNIETVVVSTIAFIIIFIYSYKKSIRFRRIVDKYKLKTPIMGMIITKSILARFARTLATTFSAGMPLVAAMKIVSRAPDNIIYEEAINNARKKIIEGKALFSSLESENLFPNVMLQMVAIGEETGELDSMLNKTAKIYEEEVDAAVDALSSLIEPAIMAILGVLVGGLVIAMYLPIFQLSDVMTR